MNVFVQALKETISGGSKPWGSGPNPLIIIGFTEAILDLGLTDEALHVCVNSYARQLSAQVHPDRPTTAGPDRQREIIEAFDRLHDLSIFQACLADFRISRAEDRREIGLLRAEMKSIRQRYQTLGATETAMRRDRQRSETEYQDRIVKISRREEEALEAIRRASDSLEEYKLQFRESVRRSYERREQTLEQYRQGLAEAYQDFGSTLKRSSDNRWWRAPIGFG